MNDRAPLGRPRQIDRPAIIAATLRPPSPSSGASRWSCRELGSQLGVSEASVARVWREYGLTPRPEGRFAFTVQPELAARAVTVVGVCLTPRVRAVALLPFDADSSVRLDADGFADAGEEQDPAARPGVRDFIGALLSGYAGRGVHLVVDDAGVQRQLLQHVPQLGDARISVHFTLDTATWLNLVDVWHELMERDGIADGAHPAGRARELLDRRRTVIWVAPAAAKETSDSV